MIENILTRLGISSMRELAERFRNRNIRFIQDSETQKKVLQTHNSTEMNFYKNYVKDKELRNLLRIGIVLKNLEKENKNEKLLSLRTKLSKDRNRLWFSQLVQNGLLRLYLDYLLENSFEIIEIEKKIKLLYENMEKFCYFIVAHETKEQIKNEIIRLLTNKPEILLISSKNEATNNIKEIKEDMINQWKAYYHYRLSEDDKKLLVLFLLRI